MLKGVAGLVTVLFVAGSAYAQEASHAKLNPTELNMLTDARIGMTKAALPIMKSTAHPETWSANGFREGAEFVMRWFDTLPSPGATRSKVIWGGTRPTQ